MAKKIIEGVDGKRYTGMNMETLKVGDRVKIACEGRCGVVKAFDRTSFIVTLAICEDEGGAAGSKHLKYRAEDLLVEFVAGVDDARAARPEVDGKFDKFGKIRGKLMAKRGEWGRDADLDDLMR